MTRIQIPVEKIDGNGSSATFFQMLIGGFAFGLIVGALSAQSVLVDPTLRAQNQVASVGESTTGGEKVFAPATETDMSDAVTEDIIVEDIATEENVITESDEPSPIDDSGEVAGASDTEDTTLLRNAEIERLSREIALLKNSSVEIITLFNQNCGSWNDICALPYATQLEKNNTAYDALVSELLTLQRTQ
jgi:hypothetical protein